METTTTLESDAKTVFAIYRERIIQLAAERVRAGEEYTAEVFGECFAEAIREHREDVLRLLADPARRQAASRQIAEGVWHGVRAGRPVQGAVVSIVQIMPEVDPVGCLKLEGRSGNHGFALTYNGGVKAYETALEAGFASVETNIDPEDDRECVEEFLMGLAAAYRVYQEGF